MSVNSGHIEQLWQEQEAHLEKRGPLYDDREKMSATFRKAQSLSELPGAVQEHGGAIISPLVSFDSKTNPYFSSSSKKLFSFVTKGRQTEASDIHIAIQETTTRKGETVDPTVYEYILNSNGSVVRKDELEVGTPASISNEELQLIHRASEVITNSVQQAVNNKEYSLRERARDREREAQYRRQKVAKTIGWTAGTLVGASLAVGGSYLAWQEWIHKPGMADDAKRAAYDAEGYSIDGRGIELDERQFTIIPPEKFAEIPTHRSGDSLETPRIVSVGSTSGCVEIDVPNLDNKEVKLGVSEYNPLGAYPVVAYRSQDQLNVCTTEEPSDDISSDDLRIAVQLVEASEN